MLFLYLLLTVTLAVVSDALQPPSPLICDEPFGKQSHTQDTWSYVYPLHYWRNIKYPITLAHVYPKNFKIKDMVAVGSYNAPLYEGLIQQAIHGIKAFHFLIKLTDDGWKILDNMQNVIAVPVQTVLDDLYLLATQTDLGPILVQVDIYEDFFTANCLRFIKDIQHTNIMKILIWDWKAEDLIETYKNKILLLKGENMDCFNRGAEYVSQQYNANEDDKTFNIPEYIMKLKKINNFHSDNSEVSIKHKNITYINSLVIKNSEESVILQYASGLEAPHHTCKSNPFTYQLCDGVIINTDIQSHLPVRHDNNAWYQYMLGTNEFMTNLLEEDYLLSINGLYIIYSNFYGPRLISAASDYALRKFKSHETIIQQRKEFAAITNQIYSLENKNK